MLPKYRPPTHPGEMLLKEFLEPLNIRQSEFARHMGWSYSKLNGIVRGRRNITVSSALALGEALQTGPLFWLNLQQNWDLWHSLKKHKPVPPINQDTRNHFLNLSQSEL